MEFLLETIVLCNSILILLIFRAFPPIIMHGRNEERDQQLLYYELIEAGHQKSLSNDLLTKIRECIEYHTRILWNGTSERKEYR